MPLKKSISGIRGTIGGRTGLGLTPIDIVKFASAYGEWLKRNSKKNRIVIGRDARISGPMVSELVINSLIGLGFDVLDLGLSTTPTVEMAVTKECAAGGIILTASHNPKQWNALKLLGEDGEFISAKAGAELLEIAELESMNFADVDHLGKRMIGDNFIEYHIKKILELDLVNVKTIKSRKLKVVIDCVNSSGGIALPPLLEALGVKKIVELYTEPNGHFPHNPEPLPENLRDLSRAVIEHKADLGIAVDPDVDRICFVCEDGSFFGEEYTLVAVADYVLRHEKGAAVSNLSSSRVLRDIAEKHGCKYETSKVGEVNVVEKMKEIGSTIGGEGNGGVIYPKLHYGRDSLVGAALFLSHLSIEGLSCKELKATFPSSFISKKKIDVPKNIEIPAIINYIEDQYMNAKVNREDGLRLDFEDSWVHLRESNTEPIIRIYAEAADEQQAERLAATVLTEIKDFCKQ